MNFIAPGAFFLGLLLPVIVTFYLLKLRRVEREVPSTFLWRRMVRDVEANAPWQRLRPNLLMILQLLFLAALILAIARPFSWAEGAGGQATILILDSSASMAAVDVKPSRIESAKLRARQLVDELPTNARVTIIDAGREARVLLSSSLDRRQAHLAIDQIQAGTGGSDLNVGLELASAIAARQPGTEIVVLSDGRVTLPQRLALKGALRYIPFGLSGDNQAVSLLTLESSPSSLTAFVQVSNYGDQPVSRRLSLLADDLLVNAFDLSDIPAGGQKSIIAEGIPAGTQTVKAQLNGTDALGLDDQAFALQTDIQAQPVTLVTQGNLFIRTALRLLPGVALTEQEAAPLPQPTGAAGPTPSPQPTRTAAAVEPSGAPALTIYDNTIPDQVPASGSLLFIAPPGSTSLFTTTGLVQNPIIREVDPSDPLLTNVSLSEVSILDAVQIPLPDWATPVVAGDLVDAQSGNTTGQNIPLIFRGETGGRRIAVIAFDLRHSDLPLQVAFPLLWTNLIDWLAPGSGSAIPDHVSPGDPLSFTVPNGLQTGNAASATITRPDLSPVQIQADNGHFVFADTNQLGIYHVSIRYADQAQEKNPAESQFAVNLFSPEESNLKPADSLPGLEAQTSGSGAVPQKSMREWWRILAFLALGLLTGEWLVYQRAALARIRDMVRLKTGIR